MHPAARRSGIVVLANVWVLRDRVARFGFLSDGNAWLEPFPRGAHVSRFVVVDRPVRGIEPQVHQGMPMRGFRARSVIGGQQQ